MSGTVDIAPVTGGMITDSFFQVHNNSGGDWICGTPVAAASGATDGILNGEKASALTLGRRRVGIINTDIADGKNGIAVFVSTIVYDTSSWAVGTNLFLSDTAGEYTPTKPLFPSDRVIVGKVAIQGVSGKIQTFPYRIERNTVVTTASFSSNNAATGLQYIAGQYDWEATDANLTQVSPSVVFGSAGVATGAHIGIVAGGAGTVDTGTIGLRVVGDSITDDGPQVVGDTEILTTDITTLSLNEHLESIKNWNSNPTIELYVSSGSPATYSLDFNYGFSSYIDAGNQDFTIINFRVEGLCGGTDSSFTTTLMEHTLTGWTYAATGFDPGNGTITDMATVLSPNSDILNGKEFKFKRILTEFIEGSAQKGYVISVYTTNNNAVQNLTATTAGVLEAL